MEFGRRVALERELDKNDVLVRSDAVFDESGNFILYGTLAGVKVASAAGCVLGASPAASAARAVSRPLQNAPPGCQHCHQQVRPYHWQV